VRRHVPLAQFAHERLRILAFVGAHRHALLAFV